MKALIAALIFTFALSVNAKALNPNFQDQTKTKTTTTVDTKTITSKDSKTMKHSKKSGKCNMDTKDCKDKGSCCSDGNMKKDVK
jgi:hypothetical protein